MTLNLEFIYKLVDYTTILTLILELGTHAWLVRWTGAALISRTVAMKYRSWAGYPNQGLPRPPSRTPLPPPILLNTHTVRLTQLNQIGPNRLLTFMDDIVIYAQDRNRQEVANVVERQVNLASAWCKDHKGSVNPTKPNYYWCS